MTDLNRRLEALSPEKRALLDLLLAEKRGQATSHSIPRRAAGSEVPLSFAQERLWFLHQLQPDNPFYNMPIAVRLSGPLDIAALQHSLNTIIQRHEVLRTAFTATTAGERQIILPASPLPLQQLDLQEVADDQREHVARRQIEQATRQPFDLQRGALVRSMLVRLGERDHILAIIMHHIISDGWSLGILVRELMVLYKAYRRGQGSAISRLPELAIQYGDFARWQRTWLQGAVLDRQLSYWRTHLAGAPMVLELPTDRPRPLVQSFRGAMLPFALPQPLTNALSDLSQQAGATLFMTLLAAFNTLLYRYTGQSDLLIGTPIANRPSDQLEGLIGYFANTLVLRTNVSGDSSFRALLGSVRETTLAAYSYQDVPFEKLVEQLQPQRDLSRNPLFQVLFALQNTPMPSFDHTELVVRPFEIDRGAAMFDLAVNLSETAAGVQGRIEYSTDLFDRTTIARMAQHFQTLLQGIAAHPDERISRLPILACDEQRMILADWNATQVDYQEDRCIHELFEAQAARTPDAIALVFDQQAGAPPLPPDPQSLSTMTYAALNERSNQLAHYLQRQGVGPETIVGICAERSLELVIGLLGILKAGGAYLPLEPAYPQERLQAMLENAKVSLLLTQQRLRARLPHHQATIICLDTDWDAIRQQEAAGVRVSPSPDNLAYVIYTSGSTGRPKGVMNTHGAIRNRLLWMQETYQLTERDRVLQKTPFSFDVSVWEFFWPLMTGARLVLVRPNRHQDNPYLIDLIVEQAISTLHFVPSMLQLFLEEPGVAACTSVRQLICSGEALPYETQERFFARMCATLHNLYGPTEAAVDVTYWACESASQRSFVPIGKPIANIQLYVLDHNDIPVPIGVPGELYIGGVGLARGYCNRPDLTAERFIPNPFGDLAGERLYRTGDCARYLPDGAIQFLGRLDHQVKIRGFRIELGEIETTLRLHPDVRDAVVIAREDQPGHKRLVAYVVRAQAAAMSDQDQSRRLPTPDLRRYLAERLPDYMVPAAFVPLDRLPLTSNGKLDRRGLPPPTQERPELATSFEPPHNDIELHLAAIWSEILGLQRIGMHDNFFELGGDSFSAIRMVRAFGDAISLVDVFKYPTIRTLARQVLLDTNGKRTLLHRLSSTGNPNMPSLICVPYGGGTPVAFHPLAQALGSNFSVYAIGLPGHDIQRKDEALQSFEALAPHCCDEILQTISGPLALYGHCTGVSLAIELARLLEAAGRKIEAVYLGAALPPPRRRFINLDVPLVGLMQRLRTDQAIHSSLKKLGGFEGLLDPEEQSFVLRNFRHDVKQTIAYFAQAYKAGAAAKITAPLFCIVGTEDPFTKNHLRHYGNWGFFGDSVQLIEIDRAGHYFVQHHVRELARVIDTTYTVGNF